MKTSPASIATALLLLLAPAFALAQTVSRVATLPGTDVPEGIAIDAAGNAYLSLESSIKRITPAGVVSTFATLPAGSPTRPLGMTFDSAGNLYAAGGGSGIVWKFTPAGVASRVATIEGVMVLNDLALDRNGNLYVTDSHAFHIYRIDPAGNVQRWSADPLLRPRATPTLFPGALGANGIAIGPQGDVYTVVTQAGRVVRIPVNSNGSAGPAQVFVENDLLAAADGMAFDANGDIYIALNSQYRIAVVKPDGRISTLAAGGELSSPTTIAFGRGAAARSLFVCNNAHFFNAQPEKTGLMRIDLGTLADPTSVRLNNVAARGRVGPDALVAGFTITGDRSKTVLVRAIGPTLTGFGVAGALTDPRLELFSGATMIDANDNWTGTPGQIGLASSLGAFPLTAGSRDAALITTLQPGSYTAQVTGVGGAAGVALLEVYEVP